MPTAVISPITTEASPPGTVVTIAATRFPAAVQPDLRVQAGSLDATGPQSYFAVVGGGSGSPVAYSTFFGQFSGPVSSALMDADPFSDRLLDVAAGDLVTFVMAVQNVAPGALAWDLVLRDTPPAGFIVPAGGADIYVSNGAGDPLAATGDLFSTTDGLHLDPGSPLAGYDPDSGLNVALVTFTLQATAQCRRSWRRCRTPPRWCTSPQAPVAPTWRLARRGWQARPRWSRWRPQSAWR